MTKVYQLVATFQDGHKVTTDTIYRNREQAENVVNIIMSDNSDIYDNWSVKELTVI